LELVALVGLMTVIMVAAHQHWAQPA